MADNKAVQEPSMEEILSSIRRIIAEDEPGPPPTGSNDGPPADMAAAAIDEDDVLELTEVVGEAEPPPPPKAAKAAPPPAPAPKEPPAMAAEIAEPLLSPGAASASTNAFAKLARAAAPETRPSAGGPGLTVEQLVVDLLTPLLRDWLDQNLPAIVERVVEQEVKKLARRAELM